MTTQILQKCLDELQKEDPRIEYVMGMLETLIATSPEKSGKATDIKPIIPAKSDVPPPKTLTGLDEMRSMVSTEQGPQA